MEVYKLRILDQLLTDQLEAAGVVLIQGAKWCGKTTTALQQAKSVLYMNDPRTQEQNLLLAETAIEELLRGATPRLIDEWQMAPQFWDAARFEVDCRSEEGQFIFTGSAVPVKNKKDGQQIISHTGTGRFAWLTMRPMSLWESGDSNGLVSLAELFNGQFNVASVEEEKDSLFRLAYLICRGGWPKSIDKSERVALKQSYNYIDAIARQEMQEVDDSSYNEISTRKLLRSYARHQATQASIDTIEQDMKSNEVDAMSASTIIAYLKALRKIFVVEDMDAWNPNLRSKSAIRTSDTRYFVDPSIATAALGVGPQDIINDSKAMGTLFETLAVRDLRVYADALDGKVYHFRDSNGLECDCVLHRRNGTYGLIEVKLGGATNIDEGAKNLCSLASKIDTDKMLAPSFCMVLTGVGRYAYQRKEDGVYVVPIACLKP